MPLPVAPQVGLGIRAIGNAIAVREDADTAGAFHRHFSHFLVRSAHEGIDLSKPAAKSVVVARMDHEERRQRLQALHRAILMRHGGVPLAEHHTVTGKAAAGDDEDLGKLAGHDQAFRWQRAPVQVRHEGHQSTRYAARGRQIVAVTTKQ